MLGSIRDGVADLRLCRYFGLSDGWWLRGQVAYDTAIAKESLHEELVAIQRCSPFAVIAPSVPCNIKALPCV